MILNQSAALKDVSWCIDLLLTGGCLIFFRNKQPFKQEFDLPPNFNMAPNYDLSLQCNSKRP